MGNSWRMGAIRITVGLVWFFGLTHGISCAETNEALLRSDLFDNCSCKLRPVTRWEDPVKVYLDFAPIYMHGLVGATEVFSVYGWLGVTWYIETLKWNPADYGGVTDIAISVEDIWVPNLGVINSVDGLYGDVLLMEKREGRLFNDGKFRINRPGTIETHCMMDVAFFPFDKQICHIEIDSWTLPLSQLELMGNGSVVKMSQLRPNGQWTVPNARVHVEATSSVAGTFKTLSFVFTLNRKPQYVLINFVLPCVAMLLMELLVFMIPPDAGEKLGFAITLLLAQTVFQLVMQDGLPQSSDEFPLMNSYVLVAMAISAMEILCSVTVLNFHHRPEEREMSSSTERHLLGNMAKCTCIWIKKGENTWVNVAKVLDRFFFWLFLFLTVLFTAVILQRGYRAPEINETPLGGFGYDYHLTPEN